MKTRVRSIIIDNSSILLIHRIKKGREYWVFPGGGVEEGEDIITALHREIQEELGVSIEINKEFTRQIEDLPETGTQEEIFYFCTISGGELGTGMGPEYNKDSHYEGMYNLEWIHFNDLSLKQIFPETIKEMIIEEVINNENFIV